MGAPIYLFDTNAIIEAVRTGVWNALTGGLNLQTVRRRDHGNGCVTTIPAPSG